MLFTSLLLTLVSLLYVAGGVAMKFSEGFSQLMPTIFVFFLFGCAAALQTWAMKNAALGEAYIFVLGLEAILAVIAGSLWFGEAITVLKVVGAVLIIMGIACLKI